MNIENCHLKLQFSNIFYKRVPIFFYKCVKAKKKFVRVLLNLIHIKHQNPNLLVKMHILTHFYAKETVIILILRIAVMFHSNQGIFTTWIQWCQNLLDFEGIISLWYVQLEILLLKLRCFLFSFFHRTPIWN